MVCSFVAFSDCRERLWVVGGFWEDATATALLGYLEVTTEIERGRLIGINKLKLINIG